MPERTHLDEQIGPTTFAEEYGDETAYLIDDNSGRQLLQVVHYEAARELVNILRSRLNASRSPRSERVVNSSVERPSAAS
jgi:hypothetical protein